MTSIQPRFTDDHRTYEAVENILGGQVVEARVGGVDNPGAGLAADASKKVLGVALTDATPGGNAPRQPTYSNGGADLVLSSRPTEFTVSNDEHVPVQYAAACAYGAKVCSAGQGKVRPWVTADGADAIIGSCREKAGVAQDGYGLTKLNL